MKDETSSGEGETRGVENSPVVAGGEGQEGSWTAEGQQRALRGGDEALLCLYRSGGFTTLCICQNPRN